MKRALDCESDLTDVCIMTGMNGPLNGEKRLARERGLVAGRRLALGNTALMQTDQVSVESVANEADSMRAQGASVMYLSVDGRLAGLLAVADPIKATTPEALATLKENGIRVVMATGDGVVTAKAVAERLGIDEYHGEVKPADKLDLVRSSNRPDMLWRWLATVSTTPPRSRKPMWALQWEQARTWR